MAVVAGAARLQLLRVLSIGPWLDRHGSRFVPCLVVEINGVVLMLLSQKPALAKQPSIRILSSSQRQHKFALDSPLEERRFELSVPP